MLAKIRLTINGQEKQVETDEDRPLLDKDNNIIAQIGEDPEWRAKALANGFKMRGQRNQWQPGKFVHPHDACFDQDGNIFIAEWVVTGRVTKLRKVS